MNSSKYGRRPPTTSARGVRSPVVKAEHKMPTPKMPEGDNEDDEAEDNEA